MNEIFELGGSLVRETVSHNLMRFLAEGTDDEDADNEIRQFAVMSYMDLLEKPVLPDILVRVICWVLGEYSYTASEYESEVILEELVALLERKFEDPGTKAWVLSVIGKLMSQMGQLVGSMRDVLEKYASAVDVELRQVDESLTFMDSFVSEALANGASPYKPMSERRVEEKIKETLDQGPTLNFTPYENPMKKHINPPTLQADKNPAVTEGRAKSQEIPKDESKIKET
ncbi:AP-4 complex subunit epsilon-1 [Acropora cervicornis]|uniref:AP-4 complex subunit epsilon-1 n=1 Tax=Acropora cervicornis TaxID=6130 RepID=A0AAD9QPY1_ACRCE|nr:AP-4 complex subunit epsilon-1 [Acropora cervicornis]